MIKSKELFINMKNVPEYDPKKHFFEQKKDTYDFYSNELEKIKRGVNIGGYDLHPLLYWHLNFFKTPIPITDDYGEEVEKIMNPPLDDNMMYFTETYKEAREKDKGVGIFGTRGFAKAERNDQPILHTDEVWRPIGDAKVGDEIFGADGKPTKILGVYPQGKVPLFEVTLRDGRSLVTCDQHLWRVYDHQARDYKTLPLMEIMKRYKYNRKYTGSKYKDGKDRIAEVYNYYVPMNKCVEFSEKDLPLDPYYVGLWLGDGSRGTSHITTIDNEIVEYLEGLAKNYGLRLHKVVESYRLSGVKGKKNPITDALRKLGIITDKHIPEIYMKGSYEQRMALLQGLMDSDGTVTKQAQVSFSQADEALAIQVRDLANSLGIHASTVKNNHVNYTKKDGSKSVAWSTILYTGEPVFRLKRKLDRLKPKSTKGAEFRRNHSAIVDIKRVEDDYATCIRVDNDDRLFITKDYIVTHNSTILSSLTSWLATVRANGTGSVVGGSATDLGAISALLETSFLEIHPAFRVPRLKSDWEKEIIFGVKKKNEEKMIHSRISITNVNKGQSQSSTEKGAGLSPVNFIVDEVGKASFAKMILSALPSFYTPHGAKLSYILSGTGGNSELSKDAKHILENPSKYKLLPMNFDRLERGIPDELITWKESYKDRFCTFVPAQMSYRLISPKLESDLGTYLGIDSKDLKKIKIKVTDWAGAKGVIDQELKDAGTGTEERDKVMMYYPTQISHCFLTSGDNPFPVAQINRRIKELEDAGDIGRSVDLVIKDGKIGVELSNKERAEVFHEKGNIDAPIIVYGEVPEVVPPKYTFVSGHDGYKLDSAEKGSLGTFYVIERRNLRPDTPIERIVASYSARPDRMINFLRTGEKLIKTWGAVCNMESIDNGFKLHLENKGEQWDWLARSFTYGTASPTGNFGLYPSKGNNEVRLNLAVDYTKEEHPIGVDKETGIPITKTGVDFIDDIDLLKEMRDYKKGGNFDRLTGFSHALAYARRLEFLKIRPEKVLTDKERAEAKVKKVIKRTTSRGMSKYGGTINVKSNKGGSSRRMSKY